MPDGPTETASGARAATMGEEILEAVNLLTEEGFGIVSPGGWWNRNIARSDPGAFVLATETKPVYGMVSQHGIKPERAQQDNEGTRGED